MKGLMTNLKDAMKEQVQRRDLKITTYKTDNKSIIVEGTLLDNRLIRTYHYSGAQREPGTVHHMIVRILVDETLVIREVETEIATHPHQDCPQTIESMQKIKGLKLTSGFTMKIKELFGRGKGCSHLSALCIAMASAAIQGFWTAIATDPVPMESVESAKSVLADTCWVWRKDGEAINSI